jgi:hypothetical protein
MSEEGGVVALQGLPFGGDPGRVSCRNGHVILELPGWLGTVPWEVSAGEVGVADLTTTGWGSGGDVFRDAIALPYLATRTRSTTPTLVLLFRHPQRLPAGASRRIASRGGVVDGVTLRVADPKAAVASLAAGGAIAVGDPARFLHQHRDVVEDPAERAALLHGDDAGRRLRQGSTVLLYVTLFLVTWLLASGSESAVLWVAPAVALVLALGLRGLSRRAARRGSR